MIFARRATLERSWLLRRNAAAGFFAVLLLASFAIAAHAQQPNPMTQTQTPTPFTWLQFKQQFGVIEPNAAGGPNVLSLPGTPTVDENGAETNGAVFGVSNPTNLLAGEQIEGFLLGDHGTSELPIPENFMRDVTAILGQNAVEDWLAPFFNLTDSGQPLSTVTIDDNNSYDTFTNAALANPTVFGTYVDGTITGAIQNSLFNPSNATPPGGVGLNVNGWETANGDPVFEQNFYLVDYRRSQNTSATTSNGLVQRADPTKNIAFNGATALATWAFAAPNPAPGAGLPNINQIEPTAPPVAATGTGIVNAPVPQSYDAYTWFPTEDASPTSLTPELHITDAEYTVQVVNQFTNAVILSTTALVDQTNGGSWVKIAGPFTVPIVVDTRAGSATQGQTFSAIVTITLDNTTNMTVNADSVTQLPNYHVVANAVELRPDNGSMYGSPVVVNASDYPELIGGYQDGGVDQNKVDVGGFPIGYRAASEGAAAIANGATGVSTAGGNFFNGPVPNGEYLEDQWGDLPSNGVNPTPGLPATVTQIAQRPIDQVVYATRSINIGGLQGNLDSTIGAVYAIDGLTGNVIWRYPSVLPFTVDDAQTANNIFTATGASANQGDTWTQGAPADAAPDNFPGTNFFNTSYTRITAQSGTPFNNAPFPTATWQLPQLSQDDQGYLVYAWFPTAVPGEQHITDAHYSVGGIACNTVNQQVGGAWVQLSWNNIASGQANDTVFDLAAGATVTLNNITANNLGANNEPPANTFVVADAVLVVPANAPGPITSTPVVVRNMRVLVNPLSGRVSARTVVMFTDNSLGSTSGGGSTIIDNAQPPNGVFNSTGGFAAGINAPGTDFFGTDYERDVPVSRATNNPGPDKATWTLPLPAGTGTQAYEVFAWFPSPTATETHIDDAQYTVNALDPNTGAVANITLDPVNQITGGGRWVQLSYVEPGPVGGPHIDTSLFYFDATHNTVTLDNSTGDAITPNTFVTADAIKFVPATPGANFSGSRVYCLDAAGNADGDDTVVDQTGEPVAYSNTGALIPPAGAPANFNYVGPLQPLHYGTTKAYWIWQPNPTAPILQTNNTNDKGGATDTETPETAPDALRDMPIPGAYELNSPTVSLTPDPVLGDQFPFTYQGVGPLQETPQLATIYIGNSNGVLYCINGLGQLNDPLDQTQRYQTADPSTPTVEVNWWFNTGGSIAYAPALDPRPDPALPIDPITGIHDSAVFVTSFDPDANNQGRLYTLDSTLGPAGNQGKGDPKSPGPQVPGSLNYNLTQIPYWSFPDANGTVKDANGNALPPSVHLAPTSTVPGFNGGLGPALPLGDIAGAPTVYTKDDDGVTRVYFAANEPTPFDDGPGTNGRIYSVYADSSAPAGFQGKMAWAYPDINGNPNAVGNVTQQDTTFDFNPTGAAGSLPNQPLGAFTQFDSTSGLVLSSSPVAGHVTFPANTVPTTDGNAGNLNGLQDNDKHPNETQMLYVGCTDGVLYALNIGVNDDPTSASDFDTNRLIYNDPIGDGPLVSTPALLPGSATNSNDGLSDVGGVVFLNSEVGNLWEIEGTPFADPTNLNDPTPIVNRDWGWAGPGGISSPALGGFDANGFTTAPATSSQVNPPTTGRIDSEWVYSGSDTGFLYGFTPNSATANGFLPGNYIPVQNIGPNNNIDLTRNFMSQVFAKDPRGGQISWASGSAPPQNPSFEWGQTVYIAIYGIDNPAVNTGTTQFPLGITVSFTLTEHDRSGRSVSFQKQISLQNNGTPPNTNVVQADNTFPPANLAAAIKAGTLKLGVDPKGFYWAAVLPYTIDPGHSDTSNGGDPYTPGPDIQISNIQETAYANGQQVTVHGYSSTPTIVNTGASGSKTSTFGLVPAIDQATFGILNPLGIAGAGTTLAGNQSLIILSPAGIAAPANALGPFTPVDTTQVANFPSPTGYQLADANGNNVPLTPPVGGSVTTGTGGTVNPTQSLSSQGLSETLETIAVAADTGEISHGTTGDTGTGSQVEPTASNAPSPALGGNFGPSFLNVADRSALGVIGESISSLRMDSPQIGWNDNSGSLAPNAVINMMPWDIAPTPVLDNPTDPSPDYPSIPNGNIHVQTIPRNDTVANGEYNGTASDITNAQGQLANAPGGAVLTRTIRPNGVLVQVSVPKYQPANLETLDASSQRDGGEHSHVENVQGTANNWVPEGYIASVKVYVDGAGNGSIAGRWDASKAYRVVNVWVGVPADMSTAIGLQTTDIGSVPAGFGLWNPNNVNAAGPPITPGAWSPYAMSPGGSGVPLYRPWFVPVPVYNTGNVNLLNVHFDQNIRTENPATLQFTTGLPLTPNQGLGMLSDSIADQPLNGAQVWPYLDTTGAYTGTANLPIVRTGLDQDIYTNFTVNPAEVTSPVPGPTAHKARPGTSGPGEPIKIPDDPIDITNPDWIDQTKSVANFYNGDPAVSIAVPMGTPVGDYSQVLRTYEGSDTPYNPWQGPEYGQNFYSPGVWNSEANVQQSFVFSSATNSPLQFFSDPGTVLKANVVENRMTDDSAIMTNLLTPPAAGFDYEQGSLSMIDPPRLLGNGLNTTTNPAPTQPHSNDIQPAAFRDMTGGISELDGFGLFWPSQRDELANGKSGYDIFSASMVPAANTPPLEAPTNPANGTSAGSWWAGLDNRVGPDDLTANSGGALTSYDPYVITSAINPTTFAPTGENTALRVDSLVGGAPVYTIMYTQFNGTEPPAGPWTALAPSSSAPIFGLKGLYAPSSLTSAALIYFWSATSGGRSQIYYQSPKVGSQSNVDGSPLILAQPPATQATASAGVLPIPAGITSVSSPNPVWRPFSYSWPDGKGVIRQWSVVDVTYSGVSSLTGQTDIYTSRYIIWQKDPTIQNDPVNDPAVLLPVPFYVQFDQTASATPLVEEPETETLTANAAGTTWEAQDVGWVRDVQTFALSYIPATQTAAVPIINNTTNVPATLPIYDRSSGQWVFNNIPLPWLANAANTRGSVYVNPDQGTVSFSTPPPPAVVNAGGTPVAPVLIASFVPQTLRATLHSGTNTDPVAFVDEAFKPNTLQLPSLTAGPAPGQPPPAQASRYWYIWRKSSGGGGGAATTASTLYFKTKRLTVVLQWPVGYPGNPSNGTVTIQPPTVTINIPGVGAQPIDADISPGHYTAQPAAGQIPPMVPGRIFLPDYINVGGNIYCTEGLSVLVNYTPAPYTDNTGAVQTPPQQQQTSFAQWLDEPYANSPTDTSFRAGERIVPINTSVNEGEPSAFLDPDVYQNTVANLAPVPHRVWLFWVSTRSAPDITNGGNVQQQGTGSDVYSEALDPRFSETSTPQ